MFRRLWQLSMISMACSDRVTRFMQSSRATTFLAGRYVAGSGTADGISRAQTLLDQHGIRSSLYYLGEYVDSSELVRINLDNKLAITRALEKTGLDVHVSVDPSQIGYAVDRVRARENVFLIASEIQRVAENREGLHCMMLDMEDHTYVDPTITLHNELADAGYPVALTLQAYLKRTAADMQAQIERGSCVRLVKGAFIGASDMAYTRSMDIKQNYRELVTMMLSPQAREQGFYPIIATHDDQVHDFAITTAGQNGWTQGEYEFEMLLGVRSDVSRALVERGERVRLYVPFGRDWWPYAVRRIGENPKNAALLIRSLVS